MFIEATPTTDQLFAPVEATPETPESPVTETAEKASAFQIEIVRNSANPDQLILQKVTNETPVEDIVDALQLKPYDKVLFIMGGAGGLVGTPNNVEDAIIDLSRKHKGRLLVITGGSDSGIIKVIGKALERLAAEPENQFQAVGICPAEQLTYRAQTQFEASDESAIISHQAERADNSTFFPPEPHHTRIVTITTPDPEQKLSASNGDFWGKERHVMYKLGNFLAAGKGSVGMVVNGGGLTIAEVMENLKIGRDLVVVRGTDRGADAISRTVDPEDQHVMTAQSQVQFDSLPNKLAGAGITGEQWKEHIKVVELADKQQIDETLTELLNNSEVSAAQAAS